MVALRSTVQSFIATFDNDDVCYMKRPTHRVSYTFFRPLAALDASGPESLRSFILWTQSLKPLLRASAVDKTRLGTSPRCHLFRNGRV